MNRPIGQQDTGFPEEDSYDHGVANLRYLSVEELRKELGSLAKKGVEGQLDEHIPTTRHGKVGLLVVDLDFYRRAREALGDPTDL
ncbi:hypothetical protein [Verrucosispora sp. TAA-831]|uniref:hypothetical protein n=1 Tax=Verrucosispora sp. TAA-831 TaxID=3422227 RepID=UPI003D6F50CB